MHPKMVSAYVAHCTYLITLLVNVGIRPRSNCSYKSSPIWVYTDVLSYSLSTFQQLTKAGAFYCNWLYNVQLIRKTEEWDSKQAAGCIFEQRGCTMVCVCSVIEILGHCQGGNFKIQNWAWFGYFIRSRRETGSIYMELISCLSRANVRAFHENTDRIYTGLTFVKPTKSRMFLSSAELFVYHYVNQ